MFSKLLYQEIGNFALTKLVHETPWGALFQAFERETGKIVAVKMLDCQKLSFDGQEKSREDFLALLKNLHFLKYPGIVHILDSDRYQQFIWIAEEWLELTTLKAFLEKNGTMPFPMALSWVWSILESLSYLHRQALKHGNLKPENIWMDTLSHEVKLSDLWLGADVVDVEKNQDTSLKPVDVHYLAPEQILKQQQIDIRTDLYALGIIFHEMLTGHPVYEGHFPFIIMQNHVSAPIPSLCGEYSELPPIVDTWFAKLLAKSPQERFLTPKEVQEYLKNAHSNLITTEETSAERPSALSMPTPPPQLRLENEPQDVLSTQENPDAMSKKTQQLNGIKRPKVTKIMQAETVTQNTRKKRFQLNRETSKIDSNDNEMEKDSFVEEVEVVPLSSKQKKLPFKPAVFEETEPMSIGESVLVPTLPGEEALPEPALNLEQNAPMDEQVSLLSSPEPFVTEHRHLAEIEGSTGIRKVASVMPDPFRETHATVLAEGQDASGIQKEKKIHSRASVSSKILPKEGKTRSFQRRKRDAFYRKIYTMGIFIYVVVLAALYALCTLPTAPLPIRSIPKVKPPQVLNASLGWFGEKLPSDMVRAEKRGEYRWSGHKKQIQPESIMMYIPEGPFWRGSEEGNDSEKPVNKVYISEFYLDKYELTNGEYHRFLDATGYEPPKSLSNPDFSAPSQPIVDINWHEANRYAKWADKRLPTEAEWEKAARGGLMIPDWEKQDIPIQLIPNPFPKRIYPWGDEKPEKKLYKVANYKVGEPPNFKDRYEYSAPVTSYPDGASPYGCLNMAGNVWEICSDRYDPEFYQTLIFRDPKGSSDESIKKRICRGGSWGSQEPNLACFRRYPLDANLKGTIVGVRLAK